MRRMIVDLTRFAARSISPERFSGAPLRCLAPRLAGIGIFRDRLGPRHRCRAAPGLLSARVRLHAVELRRATIRNSISRSPAWVSTFGAVKERVEARYPFFRSTRAEREALFGRRLRRTHISASPEAGCGPWLDENARAAHEARPTRSRQPTQQSAIDAGFCSPCGGRMARAHSPAMRSAALSSREGA